MILPKGQAKELIESIEERAQMGRYLLNALLNEKTEGKTKKQIATTEAVIKFLKEEIAFCDHSSTVAKAVIF